MKLYGFWRSLATYRVKVALALKSLKVDEVSIDILKGACPNDLPSIPTGRLNAMEGRLQHAPLLHP